MPYEVKSGITLGQAPMGVAVEGFGQVPAAPAESDSNWMAWGVGLLALAAGAWYAQSEGGIRRNPGEKKLRKRFVKAAKRADKAYNKLKNKLKKKQAKKAARKGRKSEVKSINVLLRRIGAEADRNREQAVSHPFEPMRKEEETPASRAWVRDLISQSRARKSRRHRR